MSGSATCSSFLPPHGIVLGTYSSHSAKYLWHLSFNLHFSTEQLCCSSFHMLICYWCDLFGKVFISFIKRFYLCIFRDKGRERERRERNIDVREKRQSVVSHAGPEWGLKLQPRHVPWPGIEQATFHCAGWCPINWATLVRAKCSYLMALFKNWVVFLFFSWKMSLQIL